MHRVIFECRHLACAARRIDCAPRFALPQVQCRHQVVSEHSDSFVACVAGALRQVPRSNFAALHLRGDAGRHFVPRGISSIWNLGSIHVGVDFPHDCGLLHRFDHQLLPDFVTIGGMIYGVILALVASFVPSPLVKSAFPLFEGLQPFAWPIANSLFGMAFGFGLLWLVRFFGSKAFGREAMGLGDVFLMGAVGALFGPVAVLVTMILSSIFGTIVGIGLMICAKVRLGKFVAIPYGPYICLGCLAWMFYGPQLVNWYIGLMK